jgi:hypothetical protein
MKSYTSLEQSKKLAEILPIESADMRYGYIAPYNFSDRMYDGGYDEVPYPKDFFIKNPNFSADEYNAELPCWSLSALLDLIPDIIEDYILRIDKVDGEYFIWYDKIGEGWSDAIDHPSSEKFIDAAFEMICWLKENRKI